VIKNPYSTKYMKESTPLPPDEQANVLPKKRLEMGSTMRARSIGQAVGLWIDCVVLLGAIAEKLGAGAGIVDCEVFGACSIMLLKVRCRQAC
jgi:hypothetical protein